MERTGSSGKEPTGAAGTEGGRRPTGVPAAPVAPAATGEQTEGQRTRRDPEVLEQAVRRRFTGEYKLRILEEAERCTEPGQLGALLRREGLYSSHLSTWRRQRQDGILSGLTPKRRGRKANRKDPLVQENQRLRAENERLRTRLKQAETIIGFQKKLSEMLGIPREDPQAIEKDE